MKEYRFFPTMLGKQYLDTDTMTYKNREEIMQEMSEALPEITEEQRKSMTKVWENAGCAPKGGYLGPTLTPLGQALGLARTRASTLGKSHGMRKTQPIATGVLDYFPDAIVAVAEVSYQGSIQHHPDQPVHWDRAKSPDEADAMLRHYLQRGNFDKDGLRHTAKMAWRALALLQKEIENETRDSS